MFPIEKADILNTNECHWQCEVVIVDDNPRVKIQTACESMIT